MIPRIIAAIGAIGIVAMSAAALSHAATTSPGASLRTFTLTQERTREAGRYRTAETPSLAYGEEIHVYFEPEDFGWHRRNGTAKFNVVVDAELRKRDGRIVSGKPDPRTLDKEAPTQPDDFFVSLSLKIRLPVGAYQLVIRLRDTVTGQVAEKSFPFSMVSHRSAPSAKREPKPAAPGDNADAPSSRGDCKKYLPQLGKLIAVPCER